MVGVEKKTNGPSTFTSSHSDKKKLAFFYIRSFLLFSSLLSFSLSLSLRATPKEMDAQRAAAQRMTALLRQLRDPKTGKKRERLTTMPMMASASPFVVRRP